MIAVSPSPRPEESPSAVRLGLIGDNIGRSRAPELHRLAGMIAGVTTTYERLIPKELGRDFDAVFDYCAASGYRGVNITYPYKEVAADKVASQDPRVREIRAVNTVVFGPHGPEGYNTDYSGFIAAYRAAFGEMPPGDVAMIGAGGVGRAVAFGLSALAAASIRIADKDRSKAVGLAQALRGVAPHVEIAVVSDVREALRGASGVINCTPVGMVGHEGTPVPASALGSQRWAFDAVYTPVETTFLHDAAAAGLKCLSGFELFFHQGVQAFRIFTGRDVPEGELRRRLADTSGANRGA
ncbi:MAG: shikimate dehydrogenase family protein [Propylenella sp.]